MVDYSILEPHVFWGALVGVGIAIWLAVKLKGREQIAAILLALFFGGIAVDVAAHGYQH